MLSTSRIIENKILNSSISETEVEKSKSMSMGSEARASTSSNAFSFISKSWREVRDSADADLQLMKNRANSFKNLANSFDRELENFLNSASPFTVPAIKSSASTPTEIEFVKRLQPKISEFRRVYSAPEISKRVLERWGPRARIKIDLSAIRNAIVSEADVEREGSGIVEFDRGKRGKRVSFTEFWEGQSQGQFGEWEPIRAFKTRLRDFEKKRDSSVDDIFAGFKSTDFVDKLKSSLVNCYISSVHAMFSELFFLVYCVSVLTISSYYGNRFYCC